MEVKTNFSIPQQEAIIRIKNLFGELKKDYKDQISDVTEKWDNNKAIFSFKMSGLQINGDLIVNPSSVIIRGSLPFIALPFKSTIEKTILQKANELLK